MGAFRAGLEREDDEGNFMKLRTPLLGMLVALGAFSVGCIVKEAPPANQAAAPAATPAAPAPAPAATTAPATTAAPAPAPAAEDPNAEIPADSEDPATTGTVPAQDTWAEPPNTPGLAEKEAPGIGDGRPSGLQSGAPAAFWVWRNAAGIWKVRTTTAKKVMVFTGRVKGVGAVIGRVKGNRTEFGDRLKRGSGGEIAFRFTTAGFIDGFDFRAPANACIRFDLQTDAGKAIHVGKSAAAPKASHFILCPAG
jgi:hypothetical protein